MTTVSIPEKPTGSFEHVHQGVNGNEFRYANWEDRDMTSRKMVPTGGYFHGEGLAIRYQNGPVGPGNPVNGCQVEDLLIAARIRLMHFQGDGTQDSSGEFGCHENSRAVYAISEALSWLDARTRARQEQGVEGSNLHHESATEAEAPRSMTRPPQMVGNPLLGPGREPVFEPEHLPSGTITDEEHRNLWGEEPPKPAPEPLTPRDGLGTTKPIVVEHDLIGDWSERYYNAFLACLNWQDNRIDLRMPHESRQRMAHTIAKIALNS